MPGTDPEGAHPSSFEWDQGGRVGLILNRATSSPEGSSGKEPSIKDINKLQVFRNLPAALCNRKRVLRAVLLTLNRGSYAQVWGSLAADTTALALTPRAPGGEAA